MKFPIQIRLVPKYFECINCEPIYRSFEDRNLDLVGNFHLFQRRNTLNKNSRKISENEYHKTNNST